MLILQDAQLKIRLPSDLKQKIEEVANQEKRSMNAEIVDRFLKIAYAIFHKSGLKVFGFTYLKIAYAILYHALVILYPSSFLKIAYAIFHTILA